MWQRGWRWPCFDTDLSVFVMYMRLVSIRITWFTQQKQRGLYQNKVTSSLTAIQRPGHLAGNCKWSIAFLPLSLFSHFFCILVLSIFFSKEINDTRTTWHFHDFMSSFCRGKLECLIYEMLWIKNKRPKLNTQPDSIRAKLFTWANAFMFSC